LVVYPRWGRLISIASLMPRLAHAEECESPNRRRTSYRDARQKEPATGWPDAGSKPQASPVHPWSRHYGCRRCRLGGAQILGGGLAGSAVRNAFWLLNHFTVPLFMGDLSKVRVQIDCALTQPAHSRFWGNVVSQARYSRQGQVVRPKLDLEDIRHLWRMRKSPEAIPST